MAAVPRPMRTAATSDTVLPLMSLRILTTYLPFRFGGRFPVESKSSLGESKSSMGEVKGR
jgi:hypothetical protein